MVNSFNDMVAQPQSVVYPPPSKKTLNLLASFGVTYPGNAVIPQPLELITLSESGKPLTQQQLIVNFLSEIYQKLRPNNSTKFAISISEVATNPSVQSAIYNFYTVTGNQVTDIVPDGTAQPMNSAITELEKIYNQYALAFIMNLFTTHAGDVVDNPHHDSYSNLVNLWTDFFQTLYNQYTSLNSNPISLDAFISSKTTTIENTANLTNYKNVNFALFIVPIEVVTALIEQHDSATDNSVHPTLQTTLSAETTLPSPNIYITPELFMYYGYKIIDQSDYYYNQQELNSFPRMNASLFVQATIEMTDSNTINILTLSSSMTTDSLNVVKLGTSTNSYQINLIINDNSYQSILDITSGNVIFTLVYTTTGITVSYVNDSGNTIVISQEIPDLTFDFDTIQIGLEFSYPHSPLINTIQKFAAYPSLLSSDQASLLFQTIIL